LAERDYILRRFKTTWCRITPGSYSVIAFAVGLNYVVIYSEDENNKFSKLQNEEDKSRKKEVAKDVFFVTGELKTLLERQCTNLKRANTDKSYTVYYHSIKVIILRFRLDSRYRVLIAQEIEGQRTMIDNVVEDYDRIRTKEITGKVIPKHCKSLEELNVNETYTVCRIKPITFRNVDRYVLVLKNERELEGT